jgi:hypothetical protein
MAYVPKGSNCLRALLGVSVLYAATCCERAAPYSASRACISTTLDIVESPFCMHLLEEPAIDYL